MDYPPPPPPFTLMDPVVNEISYLVEIKNHGVSVASIDANLAMPKIWAPDTYVEMRNVHASSGVTSNYSNLGNDYLNLVGALNPGESIVINVTYLVLKYDLSVYTHNIVRDLSYPNSLAHYTQPEMFIESDNLTIQSIASAAVGNSLNPFRIAEKIYSYTISHIRFVPQNQIHGALWALLNGEGDCSEYSTLFAAMMRAVGIPTRTVTGHMSSVLSLGGVANFSQLWTDSPHMWAEFYVSGYGWVPADPSSGETDPLNHFALSDSRYLPILKGQAMDAPYRSLFTLQSNQLRAIDFNAILQVRPQANYPINDAMIAGIFEANNRVSEMQITAERAYSYGFNVTPSYAIMTEAYSYLWNSTDLAELSDIIGCVDEAAKAQQSAQAALELISGIVLDKAQSSVDRAWREMRTLGALSAERYLDKAERDRSSGDYQRMVIDASYAITAADESVNIVIFVGLVAFSVFTVWGVARNHRPRS